MTREELIAAGISYDETLKRCMNNKDLLDKLLVKFADGDYVSPIVDAFTKKDYAQAEFSAHSLKGVSGNLGMTHLFTVSAKVVDLLREKNVADAGGLLEELKATYDKIVLVIKRG